MKLLILIAVAACAKGDKLDRTYLPPNHAQTSGGSSKFLQAPVLTSQRSSQDQSTVFKAGNNYAQPANEFGQPGLAINHLAQNGNGFDQTANGHNFAQGSNQYSQTGNDFDHGNRIQHNQDTLQNFESRPERTQAAFERNAAILRHDSQNDGERYSYAFETDNGISAEESGVATNGVEAQGGFSFTGDDGQTYSIRYTADQNGFVPQGDHLPTPPPIPTDILKALEQNARDEANGIHDDGSYNEAKYGAGNADNGQYNNFINGNNNFGNGNHYNSGNNVHNNFNGAIYNNDDIGNDEDTIVTDNALLRNARPGLGNQDNLNYRGATKAYLPPLEIQRSSSFGNHIPKNKADFQPAFIHQINRGSFRNNEPTNQRFGSQVNNAYLPPNGKNGKIRRSSYNYSGSGH